MTTATMAALETTECVGHRDSLSTYETAVQGKKKQTTLSVCALGAPASRCVLFLLRESLAALLLFFSQSLKTPHLEEISVFSHQRK